MATENKITDILLSYFDARFRNEISAFISSDEYRKQTGLIQDAGISRENLSFGRVTVLCTQDTVVRFAMPVKITFSSDQKEIEDRRFITAKWDIPRKENGLIIECIVSEINNSEIEHRYGSDLVPVVKKSDYPKMAQLFRQKVYHGETTDMEGYLLALEIAEKLGLHIEQCGLPSTCTGRIVMTDSRIPFIVNGKEVIRNIKSGTILFSPIKAALMSNSLMASTIIHECFHWVFHRCAFELARLSNSSDYGFDCKSDHTASGSSATSNKFIEIQTLGVVPYILSKKEDIKAQVEEIKAGLRDSGLNRIQTLESIFDEIKITHNFSNDSTRRMLLSLGYTGFRGIRIYQDGKYIHGYCIATDSLKENETFRITRDGISKLYHNDPGIKELIDAAIYVYCDGHMVLNEPKYLRFKDAYTPEITDYGYLHGDECFMKFRYNHDNNCSVMENPTYGYNRVTSEMKATYNAIYAPDISFKERLNARAEWNSYIKRWKDCESRTFAQTFSKILTEFHINKNFMDGAGVSADQIRRICTGESRPRLESLIVIAAYLNMPYEVFTWFVEQAGYDFYINEEKMLLAKDLMDDKSIFATVTDFNDYLKENGYNVSFKD